MKLSRRAVLRGVGAAGVSIALPPLESMFNGRGLLWSRAHGAGVAAPRRLIVLHWPQGVPTGWGGDDSWFPQSGGAGWAMTRCLKPLEPFRNDINIVSGLTYQAIHASMGSHGHAIAAFTGYKAQGPEPGASLGPSAQHIAAKAIGGGTRFSLVSSGLYSEGGEGWWSWSAAGVRDPLETSPHALFTRLFGGGVGGGAAPDPAAALATRRAKSILDFVKADALDLQKALGADDRRRLDDHMASIRELEKAVATTAPAAMPTAACAAPVDPGDVKYDTTKIVEYSDLMINLQVMAHRCDLTRVSFISLGPSQCYFTFPHLGITTDYHNVCHSGFNSGASVGPRLDDRATAYEYYKKIATHHMERVATLLGLLKTPDPTGATLLDSSAVIATSEFGDGGLHYDSYIPFIVAGKAGQTGAAAMPTGNNLIFPCALDQGFKNGAWCANAPGDKNRCTNDLWQSALQAVGAMPAGQKFGDPTLNTRPLPGLWV
jgi:Protein of unknown function (DUF1552)